jgi:fructokinase
MEVSLQAGLFGAVEAGGTKINMAVGGAATEVIESARVETTTPDATTAAILQFFEPYRIQLKSFGIASFGPA